MDVFVKWLLPVIISYLIYATFLSPIYPQISKILLLSIL